MTTFGGAQQRKVGRRVTAHQFCGYGLAIFKANVDIFIPFQDMVGSYDEAVRIPNDAGCWQSIAPFNPDQSTCSRLNGVS